MLTSAAIFTSIHFEGSPEILLPSLLCTYMLQLPAIMALIVLTNATLNTFHVVVSPDIFFVSPHFSLLVIL